MRRIVIGSIGALLTLSLLACLAPGGGYELDGRVRHYIYLASPSQCKELCSPRGVYKLSSNHCSCETWEEYKERQGEEGCGKQLQEPATPVEEGLCVRRSSGEEGEEETQGESCHDSQTVKVKGGVKQ